MQRNCVHIYFHLFNFILFCFIIWPWCKTYRFFLHTYPILSYSPCHGLSKEAWIDVSEPKFRSTHSFDSFHHVVIDFVLPWYKMYRSVWHMNYISSHSPWYERSNDVPIDVFEPKFGSTHSFESFHHGFIDVIF